MSKEYLDLINNIDGFIDGYRSARGYPPNEVHITKKQEKIIRKQFEEIKMEPQFSRNGVQLIIGGKL